MASRELHLHRTSLYYRLRRFEELSGLHLRNGLDRLWAHVTIKVQRLLTARAPRERPCV
jgi:DNA-binding PucR family transcriptional regulator